MTLVLVPSSVPEGPQWETRTGLLGFGLFGAVHLQTRAEQVSTPGLEGPMPANGVPAEVADTSRLLMGLGLLDLLWANC